MKLIEEIEPWLVVFIKKTEEYKDGTSSIEELLLELLHNVLHLGANNSSDILDS